MGTLRERQRARNATAGGTTTTTNTAHLDFVADPGYNQQPRLGILRSTGRTVALITPGNTKGMSPTWKANSEFGGALILSWDDVIDTGMSCGMIPNTAEQLEGIFSNLRYTTEVTT